MTGRPFYFLDLTCCNPWSVTSLKDVHRGRRFAGSCRACVRLANECPTPSVSEKLMALAAEYLERAAGLSAAPLQQQIQKEE
jgi:hypothetical protein